VLIVKLWDSFLKKMINKLKSIYLKEQFNPSLLGMLINPFYFARHGLYKNVSELMLHMRGELLDIGCGTKPYENICIVDRYIGLEIESGESKNNSKADCFYDGNDIPFNKDTFDSIMANQVFEHVFNPEQFLSEINRVCKLNGTLLLSVPFVWDEHEQPFDYARYSSFGLKHILEKNGFETVEFRKSNNGLEVIFQMINAYIFKVTQTKYFIINLLLTVLLMGPINLVGVILAKILPKNDDLYLDNIIVARKFKNV